MPTRHKKLHNNKKIYSVRKNEFAKKAGGGLLHNLTRQVNVCRILPLSRERPCFLQSSNRISYVYNLQHAFARSIPLGSRRHFLFLQLVVLNHWHASQSYNKEPKHSPPNFHTHFLTQPPNVSSGPNVHHHNPMSPHLMPITKRLLLPNSRNQKTYRNW